MLANGREQLRASVGAFLGIFVTGVAITWSLGADSNLPILIGPIAASVVLLFAVPTSPLAQPWSILGSYFISGVIGVSCVLLFGDAHWVAALAVSVSIAAMFPLRCLHPPGGATALTCVLFAPLVHQIGYAFVLVPCMLNAGILLIVALIYNNVTGRRYPHVQKVAATSATNAGFTHADIETVLQRHAEVFDISRDDLEMLLNEIEAETQKRRAAQR